MTYGKPYRTQTYDRAVAALQALFIEEGPTQVYRACGDAVAYLEQTISARETVQQAAPKEGQNGEPKERKLLLSVKEAVALLPFSRATFERERRHGHIKVVYVGSRVFAPYLALEEYVRQLCEEQGVTFDDHTMATLDR